MWWRSYKREQEIKCKNVIKKLCVCVKTTVQTHPVDSGSFLLSVSSPQHEDEALQVVAQPVYHSVSERLPAFVFVGVGIMRFDRQHGVEQQHPW